MRYRYFDDFRRGISVFAIFSYGIAVLGTPQCPPQSKIGSPLESSVRDVATGVNDFSFLSHALLALLRSLRAPAGHCFRDSRSTCETSAESIDRFHCHATKK